MVKEVLLCKCQKFLCWNGKNVSVLKVPVKKFWFKLDGRRIYMSAKQIERCQFYYYPEKISVLSMPISNLHNGEHIVSFDKFVFGKMLLGDIPHGDG